MKTFKVLIVEDEILIADMVDRYLTKEGYQVVGVAISYEEAIHLYAQEKPDLALLDIRLSGSKTGIDVAHFLQKQPEAIPFIYLTSQFDTKTINEAKDTFPAGYLSKPIQKESLYSTIEMTMHKHLNQREEIRKIKLQDANGNYLIPIKDILYLESDHIYVKVNISGSEQILQRSTLKDLLDELPSGQFIQTHRSFAVNVNLISHWDQQHLYIQNQAIPISRSRRTEVLSYLKTE